MTQARTRPPSARQERESSVDHDLLIRMEVKLDALTAEMQVFKTDWAARVAKLEVTAAGKLELEEHVHTDRTQLHDHEGRLRRLEYGGAVATGVLMALQFVLKFVVK